MGAQTFNQIIDPVTGGISYVPTIAASQPQPLLANIASTLATWSPALSAAGAMVPTAFAAPVAALLAPDALTGAINVAAAVASGNYVGAVTTGLPLILSVITAIYAVFTPTSKGPTDAQIHTSVARMSHDQLVSLLTSTNYPNPVQAATSGLQSGVGANHVPATTSSIGRIKDKMAAGLLDSSPIINNAGVDQR